LDIQFAVGTSCERAAPLAEKNAAARHHVLRTLISLHNEHRVYTVTYIYIYVGAGITQYNDGLGFDSRQG
jgi:hypothetical protein